MSYNIGNYLVDMNKFLGKGAFSTVYLGTYIKHDNLRLPIGTPVAVKIINKKTLSSKSQEAIREEIRIIDIIRSEPHPNIVEFYDVIYEKDKIYIIMEYCSSGDMRGILKKPIKEKYAQFYFSQLANGLRYLYNKNIVHRDIKPRNILLTNNRRVLKIADFGFAKQLQDDNFMYQTVCGSPLYMAPEIIKRSDYNNQTDLWSLGMILYEILFGFHPFHNCKSIPELKAVMKHDDINIPPENTKNISITIECLDFLTKLLKKEVKDRLTWDEFFTHPWVNSLEDDKQDYKNVLCASSLGSIAPSKKEEPLDFEVVVINDYVESIIDHDSDNEEEDNDCMFNMEIDQTSFVHKSSVLDSNSNVYECLE